MSEDDLRPYERISSLSDKRVSLRQGDEVLDRIQNKLHELMELGMSGPGPRFENYSFYLVKR